MRYIIILLVLTSCVSENTLYYMYCPPGPNNELAMTSESFSKYLEGYISEEETYYLYTNTKNQQQMFSRRCLITTVHEDLHELIYDILDH